MYNRLISGSSAYRSDYSGFVWLDLKLPTTASWFLNNGGKYLGDVLVDHVYNGDDEGKLSNNIKITFARSVSS
jgi:hypothetical protein